MAAPISALPEYPFTYIRHKFETGLSNPLRSHLTPLELERGYDPGLTRCGQIVFVGKNQNTEKLAEKRGKKMTANYCILRYAFLEKTSDINTLGCAVLNQLAYTSSRIDYSDTRLKAITFRLSNFRLILGDCLILSPSLEGQAKKGNASLERNLILHGSEEGKKVTKCLSSVMKMIARALHFASSEQGKRFGIHMSREICLVDPSRRDTEDRFNVDIVLQVTVPLWCMRQNGGDHPEDSIFSRASQILKTTGLPAR